MECKFRFRVIRPSIDTGIDLPEWNVNHDPEVLERDAEEYRFNQNGM